MNNFIKEWNRIAELCKTVANEHGWKITEQTNDGELLMLVVSELSEGLEALRLGNPKSEHIPYFTGIEEELADVVIRIMHMSMARGWDVGEAIVNKIAFNETRSYRHGGKEF